jgi:hypothetical protein
MDPLQAAGFGDWPEIDEDDTPAIAPPKLSKGTSLPVTVRMLQEQTAWPVATPAILPSRQQVVVRESGPARESPSPFTTKWTQAVPPSSRGSFLRQGIATASAFGG